MENKAARMIRGLKKDVHEIAWPIALRVAAREKSGENNRREGVLDPERQGVCAEADPELFFSEQGHYEDTIKARKLCLKCPMLEACIERALCAQERFGVAGGMTVSERYKILKEAGTFLAAQTVETVADTPELVEAAA